MNKLPIFCLMGPTASGKTDLACELLQHFPCEIISVDSAMIYREMNIGTAKPTADILLQAPHHLIDILDPIEKYSAAHFCADVKRLCETIIAQGKIPLLVGGTMMYFRALQYGLSNLPEADEALRSKLLKQADEQGWLHMHGLLLAVDPEAAQRIHPHDTQRLQRALEVYYLTGRPLSHLLNEQVSMSNAQFVNFLLLPDSRVWLHERIKQRFEHMLAIGFIEEVEHLLQKWPLETTHPSIRCVGYRQIWDYLYDHNNLAELKEKGVAATRQLAKRQLTWLRQWESGHHLVAEATVAHNVNEIVALMRQILDN